MAFAGIGPIHFFLFVVFVSTWCICVCKKWRVTILPACLCLWLPPSDLTSYKHRIVHAQPAWASSLLVLGCWMIWRYSRQREQELKAQYIICSFQVVWMETLFSVCWFAARVRAVFHSHPAGIRPLCRWCPLAFLFFPVCFFWPPSLNVLTFYFRAICMIWHRVAKIRLLSQCQQRKCRKSACRI